VQPQPASSLPGGDRPSRRLVLQGALVTALAWGLAGCTGNDSGPGLSGSSLHPTPDPAALAARADIRLVLAAIAGERATLGYCMGAIRRFPGHGDDLRPVAAEQSAHVDRLEAALFRVRVPAPTSTPKAPHRVDQVTPALVRLEDRLTVERATDCLAASSGPLAALLGSMRACHAVRSALLADRAIEPTTVAPPKDVRDVGALTDCLSAEYAAVYGYGVVGGALRAGVSDGPLALRATAQYRQHQARRDALIQLFDAAGRRPPAALPAYRIPFDVSAASSARRLARSIESRCAAVYVRAIAATTGDGRRFCSDVLTDCARSAVAWGAAPVAFPGLPERS
jgi:hypothetical protein